MFTVFGFVLGFWDECCVLLIGYVFPLGVIFI